jgi:hypothetical protein
MLPQPISPQPEHEPADEARAVALTDLLWQARRACGGDLDNFLLLLAIARRNRPEAEPDPTSRGKGAYAQSMAAALAMPRETVRRKVAAMVAQGWLVRVEGRLHLAPDGKARLAPLWRLAQRL